MQRSESIKELSGALCKAQGVLLKAKKDSVNPHFKSRYADLESVWDACRESLSSNGLSVMQMPESDTNGRPMLTTILSHSSGEYISSSILLTVTKPGPQDVGSNLTYFKRYCLAALVGIADADDDGELAERRKPTPTREFKPSGNPPKIETPKKEIVNFAPQTQVEARAMELDILNGQSSGQVKSSLDSYVIKFGKWSNIPIRKLQIKELNDYRTWIKANAEKTGKPISTSVSEFLDMIELLNLEQAPAAFNNEEPLPF